MSSLAFASLGSVPELSFSLITEAFGVAFLILLVAPRDLLSLLIESSPLFLTFVSFSSLFLNFRISEAIFSFSFRRNLEMHVSG